tara:strand:- start:1372 stop:1527 length:156 start_codon:yes stop_codon:yes gene_type:complete
MESALHRAIRTRFEATGETTEALCDIFGIGPRTVSRALSRKAGSDDLDDRD